MRFTIGVAGLAAVLGLANSLSATAHDLDACDFNKSNGSCSASFALDRKTNWYTIAAAGICRTVTVQIDGTQYPHKQYNLEVNDSVMVLDKSKPYDFKISGCTAHPTREEVVQRCEPPPNACIGQKPFAAFWNCVQATADQFNACVGARHVEAVDTVLANGTRFVGWRPTGEYLKR